jgi:hypothetical protein
MRLRHVLVLVLTAAAPSRLHAELRVAAAVVDLGELRGGQKAGHHFELVNTGADPIDILDLQRGCGCLAPKLDMRRIPAGGRTALAVELRTLGQAEGPHAWRLQVHYRQGEATRTLPLELRGVLRNEITVEPALLGMHIAKAVEQTITLTDTRAAPLRVVHAEARAPGVAVKAIERAGKTTRIIVGADARGLAPGRHDGLVSITTDDAEYGQLQVPVVLTKGSDSAVRAVPERVVLRLPAGVRETSALIRLRSAVEAARVAKVEPSAPDLRATWAAGPGNDATLKVQAARTRAAGTWQGHLEIHVAAPAGEVVTVPVIVVVE